jgi:hypothetical protein
VEEHKIASVNIKKRRGRREFWNMRYEMSGKTEKVTCSGSSCYTLIS